MSLLRESQLDDRLMVRYLLRLLPDEEADRLDEMSIADDETAWRLRVAENDLVDAYVSGALTGETLERFESYYLASGRRRQKVEFARSLRAAAASREVRSAPASIAALSRRWLGMAAAAALVLAVSGAMVWQDARLRTELDQAHKQTAALDRQARDLEQQLQNGRAATVATGRGSAPVHTTLTTQSPARTAPVLTTVALVLLAQTRSVGTVAELSVPPGTDRVAFDLRLESNRFPRYRVVVKDPATGEPIWQSGELIARSVDDQATVSGVFPANLLKFQHYSIEVTGRADGDAEFVGSYAVQIVGR
jgi:hypothetical protein